ncbi:MAG TPA: sugar phosphate isomerase/epimerase, partial [bacterium]|nr:sugar phosphate isomerase/epimerase [bacterium]
YILSIISFSARPQTEILAFDNFIDYIDSQDESERQANMKMNNKPQIGITIDHFKGIKPPQLLKIVNRLGLEFVEITESVFEDLTEMKKNLGNIQTGFHLPNLHDAGYDFSDRKHQPDIRRLIGLINTHHQQLNINYCLSHPPEGKHNKSDFESASHYLLENLQQLKPPVLIENVQNISESQFRQFYSLAREKMGEHLLGQCFDAAHYLLSGNDPLEFVNRADGEVKCFHLSDCKANLDAHLPFGRGGELPIEEILSAIKQTGFQGYINLELLPRSMQDVKPLIDSYLQVVRTFNCVKFITTKFRLIFYSSLIKKYIKGAFLN